MSANNNAYTSNPVEQFAVPVQDPATTTVDDAFVPLNDTREAGEAYVGTPRPSAAAIDPFANDDMLATSGEGVPMQQGEPRLQQHSEGIVDRIKQSMEQCKQRFAAVREQHHHHHARPENKGDVDL
ncbi:hypothetical protein RI367_001424 [Sorochytrium milnesiophthora]